MNTFVVRIRVVLALKQKCPKINIWDIELGKCGFSGHLTKEMLML
jgi:hypothetical protein